MGKKFKPFQKVIVRDGYGVWGCDLYSHWDENEKSHRTVGFGCGVDISDEEILSFEEYSHLLGTTDTPDEEVRLEEGEIGFFFDNKEYALNEMDFQLLKFCFINKDRFKTSDSNNWNYAIRFKDFDPSNMDETKKHILCVKGGKVVKYKN